MSFGKRLKYYLDSYYESTEKFCTDFNIDRANLGRYVNDKIKPSFDTLNAFYKIGASIDWLISGQGNQFNNEAITLMQSNKHIVLNLPSPIARLKNLSNWIDANYGSLMNLCDELGYDYQSMYLTLEEKRLPNPDFIRRIENAGCNLVWFYTGKGSSYASNPMGLILQNKIDHNGVINITDPDKSEEVNNICKLIDLAIKNDAKIQHIPEY